jgi:hypothetical protein
MRHALRHQLGIGSIVGSDESIVGGDRLLLPRCSAMLFVQWGVFLGARARVLLCVMAQLIADSSECCSDR